MHGGVLPQIYRREVKSERLHGALERQDTGVGDHVRPVQRQRFGDDFQIIGQLIGRDVRRRVGVVRLASGRLAGHAAIGRGESAVNAGERAAIRLVGAET